jgi:GDPmannose 4,6-dehydratase
MKLIHEKFKNLTTAFNVRWDYSGLRKYKADGIEIHQKEWDQTLITRINELSAQIHMSTLLGPADTVVTNSKCASLIHSFEYYDHKTNRIGKRYELIIDDSIKEDRVYVYNLEKVDECPSDKLKRLMGMIIIDNLVIKNKVAFLTGITGQDGSYLAELLLEKGYIVHATMRRASTFNTERIEHIMGHERLHLHHGDITDPTNIMRLMSEIKPNEIYNLAAQSHVAVSFEVPHYTANVDALGTLTILEAMRAHCPTAKFYQASTSELYGGLEYNKNSKGFYDEDSPMHPRSPYGCAKLYGFWIIRNYRESYGLFACNGILFNHESERRGKTFVTRKITTNMAQMKKGKRDVLTIGNMEAERDWGHAQEYVEGMWRMLQQDSPQDFVLATGKAYKVRTFIEMTAKHLGWEIEWRGEGVEEKGYDKKTGKLLVEVDPRYFRPAEVDRLIGDPSKAKAILGWEAKIDLDELVEGMVKYDLEHE